MIEYICATPDCSFTFIDNMTGNHPPACPKCQGRTFFSPPSMKAWLLTERRAVAA